MLPWSRLELRLECGVFQVLALPGRWELPRDTFPEPMAWSPLASSAVLSVYLASVKVKKCGWTDNVLLGPAPALLESSRSVYSDFIFLCPLKKFLFLCPYFLTRLKKSNWIGFPSSPQAVIPILLLMNCETQ